MVDWGWTYAGASGAAAFQALLLKIVEALAVVPAVGAGHVLGPASAAMLLAVGIAARLAENVLRSARADMRQSQGGAR